MFSVSRVLLFFCLLGLTTAVSPCQIVGCNVSKDVISLPPNTTLAVPSGVTPAFIALGTGTQNYSCNAAGTATSIGAVATLFDASCLQALVTHSTDDNSTATTDTVCKTTLSPDFSFLILGRHFFVPNPTGAAGVVPKFDFTSDSQVGNPDAFVVATKAAGIHSPSDPTVDVDWLMLQAVAGQGSLAKFVFRIRTIGGQPPASCTPGSVLEVPYVATYWFFD